MHTKINKQPTFSLPSSRTVDHDLQRLSDLVGKRVKPYLTRKNALLAGAIGLFILSASYSAAFLWPRGVAFSYAGNNCFINPVVLPNLISKNKSPTYKATPGTSFSVAGYPVYSRDTCVTPIGPPKQNSSEVINFGAGLFKKNIKVSAGAFPLLANQSVLGTPVSTQNPLVLKLDRADDTFDYRLLANKLSLACSNQSSLVICDVTKLNLAQSTSYNFKLERMFNGVPGGAVFERSLATVQNVHISGSSIADGQTVYDLPNELTLNLSRPAVALDGARLSTSGGQEVSAATTLDGDTITVAWAQPLARDTSFVFKVDHIKAADGGFLPAPFALGFKTSGGPKVLGVNIGSYKVSVDSNIVITFDSPLSRDQAAQNFVSLQAGGNAVAAAISAQNNSITIKPSAALPRCAPLTVKVLDGIQNTFGVAGGSGWTFKSRTICQTVFSIGTSVQGRAINAYSFGSGSSKIIFVGTTHGNEKSSTYSLNSWIDYLESNAGNIPANRTIIVIPNLNPDGYAANRRTNAHNVDLNRNFPANNWKSGVIMPDLSFNAIGGGGAPLSEPESSALASYVLGQAARLVLTYHAPAGVVIPNDSGDSAALAQSYSQKSNLNYASSGETDSIFHYDTTGAFEDWLHDKPGIPAILVELRTQSGNEFNKNQAAMWALVLLP